MEKKTKKEEYIFEVKKFPFLAYVDEKENIIGIFSDIDSMLSANKNLALKKLRKLYKFNVQMVIR